ncbi:hypothetical protein [Methylosinus sporium]|uniref:hypothetical protein n=1 Tax=Methylosinus sporium TaxID=428 RepID=UPI00383B3319
MAIDLRHVRMQERGRLLSFGESLLEFFLPVLQFLHLPHHALRRVEVVGREDQLDELVEFAIDARDFGSLRGQVGSTLHSQTVHLAGELVAEFLEQLWLHQMGAQAIEH